ncbi:MAG: tRNA(Phe) 7-((3-amino-3-carboxypropyl)-4-demethylwyosine(37)-N(4))-methyltransferase [Vulcanisaeta sp.]|uniref:tRNA(Phe) 7-((3-amino-3-carboxypropyl)-4-demethylwyosine(37)-N(4))- methyltransferase n=1 Tax=Vulcanisaeta sp. TaxID=2020871 RepID=UPI003D108137
MVRTNFDSRKSIFLKRLMEEGAQNRVDFDIYDFLLTFNKSLNDFYTTSSCSGRIALAKAPRLSYSKGSGLFKFVVKWHRPVTYGEVMNVLSNIDSGDVWLLVRAPIIHFVARDIHGALTILRMAREAGFKHSGIYSVTHDGVVVEVQGEDRFEVPIIINGKLIVTMDDLRRIIDIANETLIFGKFRLAHLIRLIEVRLFGKSELGEMPKVYFQESYRDFNIESINIENLV